jgi:hypothetical protein
MSNGVGGLHSTTCVVRWWHALLFMLQNCAPMMSMFQSWNIKCQCLSQPMCRFSWWHDKVWCNYASTFVQDSCDYATCL